MVRQNSTNFYFYQRANATDPWQPGPAGQFFAVQTFAGLPMQVGIGEGGFDSDNVVTAQFDSFMLDTQAIGPTITVSSSEWQCQYKLAGGLAGWPPYLAVHGPFKSGQLAGRHSDTGICRWN